MPEQLNNLLQQQLRDVHLPEPISWWPLAIGWWLLAGLILLAVYFSVRTFVRSRKRKQYRKQALAEINATYQAWQTKADTAAYLQSANAILKRAVLHFQKPSDNNKLTGQAWVERLARYRGQSLSDASNTALSVECYQAKPDTDIDQVHLELCDWIKNHHSSYSPKVANQVSDLEPQGALNA